MQRWMVVGVLLFGAGTLHAQATPEAAAPRASLSSLFSGRSAGADPASAELLSLLAELRARPAAAVANDSLARAQTAIDTARVLGEQRAAPSQITRQKQLAWAALSLADRLMARADAQAALREAETRAAQAPRSSAALTAPDNTRIRALAPDFLARAESARGAARAASAAQERADHEARAQLLFAAAATEAERIELDRQRVALEARALAAEATRADEARKRFAAEADAKLLAAASQAEQEAARAFATVQSAQAAKPANAAERALALQQARAFFMQRARLTLDAAQALGARGLQVTSAEQQLAAARAPKLTGVQAVTRSQQALAAAQRVLGAARAAASPAPAPGAAEDLLARVRELGLPVQRAARGVAITLPAPFAAGQHELARPTQTKLAALRDLLAAFPHGEVRIEAHAQAGSAAASQRLARARAERLATWLAPTLARERLVAAPESADSAVGDRADNVDNVDDVQLVLPAYGASP